MGGLQKSLDQISQNPEIKKIIDKTNELEQRLKDEDMFKIQKTNAASALNEARKNINAEENASKGQPKLKNFETIGIKNINYLRNKFQRSLQGPIKKIKKAIKKKTNKLKKIEKKVKQKLDEIHNQLESMGLNKKDYMDILKKFPNMSDFNLWIYKQIRDGKKNIENMPQFIVYKEDQMQKFLEKTKHTFEKMLDLEKKFLAKNSKVAIDNDFLFKFMKTINSEELPKIELPFYPRRDRYLPKLP